MSLHLELGHGLWLDITESKSGATACLTQMPERDLDSGERLPGPDLMIMRWEDFNVECVKVRAARALRAMAKLIDGLPIVTSVEVRNEPVAWDRPHDPPSGAGVAPADRAVYVESLERLKVMVTLEDDSRQRIVQEQIVEPLNQTINHATNAYSFADRRIDPVSERWRKEREKQNYAIGYPAWPVRSEDS
jgi:hypothetical protein